MICGALIIRASSCSATNATAIPSRSPTMLPVFCCYAKLWNRTKKTLLSGPLSGFSRNAACRRPSAPTTAFRLLLPTDCSTSLSFRCLGISIERIRPGHPQQNGRHERMHLTLKQETTRPAAANILQQQARFDAWVEQYNQERPHQALGMNVPADVYTRSPRLYRGLEDLTYPFHDAPITVTHCGRICFH